jgi:hypothetical protein
MSEQTTETSLRARVVDLVLGTCDARRYDIEDAYAQIDALLARALDAARAEERKSCALIAREYCESAYAAGNREAEDTAERIEAAIFARGEPRG